MTYNLRKISYRPWRVSLLFTLLSFLFLFLILNMRGAAAQTMSNSQYTIRMGNLNSISGLGTGSGYRVSFTSGETAPGLYNTVTGANFKVRGGFQYIMSIIPFSFKIDNIFIDYGTIYPGSAFYRTNNLTVSTNSSKGYAVTVSENHPLRIPARGIDIPDTICDALHTCNTTTANTWNLPGTYGFGYRCDNTNGTDCDSQFLVDSYQYRPFAASPSAVTVMSATTAGRGKKSQITYKLNISNVQAAGLYTNVINFIATPTY